MTEATTTLTRAGAFDGATFIMCRSMSSVTLLSYGTQLENCNS